MPAGLRKDHTTKAGSWALIRVAQGTLRYSVTDPRRAPTERHLTPGTAPGVVEPTIVHRVEPVWPVRFHVEFLREAASASPACRDETLAEQENRELPRR